MDHANSTVGREMVPFCTWCWRLHGSSGALGFMLLLLLEAVGEFGEQATISQSVACSLVSPLVFKAVDRAGSFQLLLGCELT